MAGRTRTWTDEQLIEAVAKSNSLADTIRNMDLTPGSRPTILKRIAELELDTCHFGKASGFNKDGNLNAHWKKFLDKLETYEQVPVDQWKVEQFLGHILKKYKDRFDFGWTMRFTKPPSKSEEIFLVKMMIARLGTEDPTTIKQYIEWTFDNLKENYIFKTLGVFVDVTRIYKFKVWSRKNKKITRSTKLPEPINEIILSLSLPVDTYGDLAFAKLALDSNEDSYPEYVNLFNQLRDNGFDMSVLESLED